MHKEFMKVYEELNRVSNVNTKKKTLTESRSVAEIEAEIAKLQKELEVAKVAEKKASYNSLPTKVWIWDVYLEPSEKGTWTSAELYKGKWDGTVFETEEKALEAAWYHLGELDDEGELWDEDDNPADPDDYYVEAFQVDIIEVDRNTLIDSNLEHLI